MTPVLGLYIFKSNPSFRYKNLEKQVQARCHPSKSDVFMGILKITTIFLNLLKVPPNICSKLKFFFMNFRQKFDLIIVYNF